MKKYRREMIRILSGFLCLLASMFFMFSATSCGREGAPFDMKPDLTAEAAPGDTQDKKIPREVVVVVDPGHGGEDQGTGFRTLYEKDLNLDISLRLGEALKKDAVNCVFTRETDNNPSLVERAEVANNLNAALFISIHNNAMPGQPAYKGTETLYCPTGNESDGILDGKRLASLVQQALVDKLGTYDNGIISRPNLAVLRRTSMPAVIAEIAYLSNSSDRMQLTREEFPQQAAEAIHSAVMAALQEMGAVKGTDGKWMIH
jgi:N-acetylmuramoyl-L-alanine amidase